MLNIPSPSVAPAPARRAVQPPARHTAEALLLRRRGGQPSNRNALHHGLYAAKNQTPFSRFSASIIHSRQKILGKGPRAFRQALLELQESIVLAMQSSEKAANPLSLLSWHRLLIKMINNVARLKTARFMQQQPLRFLQFVAQNAPALIRYNFHNQGITRDADSFREKCVKSDFNSLTFCEPLCAPLSEPAYPFISPRQWLVLEPLLPPPDHARRRGRPPTDPRELLDAVFWKFAHHAHWQDLPDYYPPMLTCRRYYRRLFLSGRLATLYSALYKDLLTRGKADLTAFVEQGCFTITKNKLSLRADLDETWQMRTALLFIQQGYQVFRRFQRETKQARRTGFPFHRIPSMKPLLNPLKINGSEFSFTPIDLANPGQTPQMMMNPLSIPYAPALPRTSASPRLCPSFSASRLPSSVSRPTVPVSFRVRGTLCPQCIRSARFPK